MTNEEATVVRDALDTLKEKWQEAQGGWALLDFMEAAGNDGHWMRKVVAAERLVDDVLGVRES